MKLHLGCGRDTLEGWINLDKTVFPGVTVVADLDEPLPFAADSITEVRAVHLLEHIPQPLDLMEELHRACAVGAVAVFNVPYGSSDDAWEDPTHVRPYFLGSWGYFGQPLYWRTDYGYRGDWEVEQIVLFVPRRFEGQNVPYLVQSGRNVVREMAAALRAVKPIRSADRELQRRPQMRVEFVD
jgi:SAM-dependent methyltransferase